MQNIWPILNTLKKEYYDLGFCKIPIEDTPDARWMLQVSFNDILGEKVLGSTEFDEGKYELDPVVLEKGDIVLDCGANLGLFTALACDRRCKVYAIEPMPNNITSLEKLQILNPSFNFEIIPYAVTDKNGPGIIYTCSTDRGLATVEEGIVNNPVYSKPYDSQLEVNFRTIDYLVKELDLPRVDFIKADIEGGEENMLRGAQETLKQFKPKLSICTYHLPTSKQDIENIILSINPEYKIIHQWKKLYAY